MGNPYRDADGKFASRDELLSQLIDATNNNDTKTYLSVLEALKEAENGSKSQAKTPEGMRFTTSHVLAPPVGWLRSSARDYQLPSISEKVEALAAAVSVLPVTLSEHKGEHTEKVVNRITNEVLDAPVSSLKDSIKQSFPDTYQEEPMWRQLNSFEKRQQTIAPMVMEELNRK